MKMMHRDFIYADIEMTGASHHDKAHFFDFKVCIAVQVLGFSPYAAGH